MPYFVRKSTHEAHIAKARKTIKEHQTENNHLSFSLENAIDDIKSLTRSNKSLKRKVENLKVVVSELEHQLAAAKNDKVVDIKPKKRTYKKRKTATTKK
jgi:peptidoglycan hydrolase CwlO-like protein